MSDTKSTTTPGKSTGEPIVKPSSTTPQQSPKSGSKTPTDTGEPIVKP
jgi:hypothetical protein